MGGRPRVRVRLGDGGGERVGFGLIILDQGGGRGHVGTMVPEPLGFNSRLSVSREASLSRRFAKLGMDSDNDAQFLNGGNDLSNSLAAARSAAA